MEPTPEVADRAAERIRLADLVSPLAPAEFIARHWERGAPFLGRARDAVVQRLRSDPALGSIEALLPRLAHDVVAFGPDGSRAVVPPAAALDLLDRGHNLYVTEIERAVPGAPALFHDVARELGIAPWQIRVEAFAGRAGGVSSRHFDHDINFQILLEGEKLWRLERNAHIENPLRSYHPSRERDGSILPFHEEAHAIDRDLPAGFTADMTELCAAAGAVVYVPRGHWHEVCSRSSTWAINLVVRGLTWAQVIGNALIARLHRRPELRAYCDGLDYGTDRIDPEREPRAAAAFEVLRAAALDALGSITRVEAALSGIASRYRWSAAAAARAIVIAGGAPLSVPGVLDEPIELDDATVAPLGALLTLRGSFSWADAQTVGGDVGPIELQNLIHELIELGLIELV